MRDVAAGGGRRRQRWLAARGAVVRFLRRATVAGCCWAAAWVHAGSIEPIGDLRREIAVARVAGEPVDRPVCVRGVVTFEHHGDGKPFFVQDDTGGIYIDADGGPLPQVRFGARVTVEGRLTDDGFAGLIRPDVVRADGLPGPPNPRSVRPEDFAGGVLDAQYVRVTGILRGVQKGPRQGTTFDIEIDGRRIEAWLSRPFDQGWEHWIGSDIRCDGVGFTSHRDGHFIAAWVGINGAEGVSFAGPPPRPPFELPMRPIDSLLRFRVGGGPDQRVLVRGRVKYASLRQRRMFVDDGTGTMQVLLAKLPEKAEPVAPPRVGDVVVAVGFPRSGEITPVLEDSVFRVEYQPPDAPPFEAAPPPVITADNLMAPRFDGRLVMVEARLIDRFVKGDEVTLFLEVDGRPLEAHGEWVVDDRTRHAAESIPTGSTVRVVGIHDADYDRRSPYAPWTGSRLMLRTRGLDDFIQVAPPAYWHRQRMLTYASVVLAVLLTAVSLATWRHRHTLARQRRRRAEAERQFAAVLAERGRLSRELHDSLAQGLTGVSIQIECARDVLRDRDDEAARDVAGDHLTAAGEMVRYSLTEARRSIDNMRSSYLDEATLLGALRKIGTDLTADTSIDFEVRGTESARRPPKFVEAHLLRIGQEAITNAVRHSGAGRITASLDWHVDTIELAVQDDGVGFSFDPSRAAPGGGRSDGGPSGLGLMGIRERVRQIGGSLRIGGGESIDGSAGGAGGEKDVCGVGDESGSDESGGGGSDGPGGTGGRVVVRVPIDGRTGYSSEPIQPTGSPARIET